MRHRPGAGGSRVSPRYDADRLPAGRGSPGARRRRHLPGLSEAPGRTSVPRRLLDAEERQELDGGGVPQVPGRRRPRAGPLARCGHPAVHAAGRDGADGYLGAGGEVVCGCASRGYGAERDLSSLVGIGGPAPPGAGGGGAAPQFGCGRDARVPAEHTDPGRRDARATVGVVRGSPSRNVAGSRSWSARTVSCVERTRFFARRRRISPRRSTSAARDDDVVHRRPSWSIRGQAGLRASADCPIDVLRAQGA